VSGRALWGAFTKRHALLTVAPIATPSTPGAAIAAS